MAKKKHVQVPEKQKNDESEELTIEDILELGGDKKDFELLAGLDDDAEELDVADDWDADTVNKDDLRDFIKTLGFNKLKESDETESKPKKVKLLVAEGHEEEEEEPAPEETTKKKKNKNKFKTDEDETKDTKDTDVTEKKKKKKESTEIQSSEISSSSEYGPRTGLLFRTIGTWYEQFNDECKGEISDTVLISQSQSRAEKLLEHEAEIYKKQQDKRKGGNAGWLRKVLTSGTLSDRVAAYTLLVQQSPVHSLLPLQKMLDMLAKKGKREALTALDALKELFVCLLPDRKLKTMKQYPLNRVDALASGNKDSRDKRLCIWYFEQRLKEQYAEFVVSVKTLSHDTVPAVRKKAIGAAYYLLCNKPELEKELLSLLVNKLGDPDSKTASKAGHYLSQLVEMHPNMKPVVVEEVERMLFRPNIAAKAQYYAVCFMNQLLFLKSETALASKLIGIYFSLFGAFVKKGDVDSKMLRALLTGVNRAYPFAKVERSKIEEQMNTIYKVVHVVNFQTSIQALMLLHQVTDSSDSMCERYYSALYRKMLDPALHASNKQAMFLNLLYRSMDKDVQDARVKAFIKRLLQVCCHQPVPFVCGALVLLSELTKKRKHLFKFTKIAEDADDDDEEHFTDVALPSDEDDEEEHFVDADSEDEKENDDDAEKEDKSEVDVALEKKGHTTVPAPKPSWVHRKNQPRGDKSNVDYDMHHRNPLYCHAEHECTYELNKLAHHLHPTVALFTKHLLAGERIQYSGDPLEDFTLINFLNRFVYRNPKKQDPAAKQPKTKRATVARKGAAAIPVNSKEYLDQGEDAIPEDEKFMFKYFSEEAKRKTDHTVNDVDSDAESVDDDDFDAYLDKFERNFAGGDKEYELDIAGEFGKPKGKKSGDEDDSDDDEDLDEDDDDLDLSGEEMDFDDDEMGEMFGAEDMLGDEDGDLDGDEDRDFDGEEEGDTLGFDEEGIDFSDEEAGDAFSMPAPKKRRKNEADVMDFMNAGKKKRKLTSSGDMFAAAEEFAHLIDDNAGGKFDMIGTDAMANKDNASVKQLKWEADRDRWMNDRHWKQKPKRGGGPANKKKHGKPRRK